MRESEKEVQNKFCFGGGSQTEEGERVGEREEKNNTDIKIHLLYEAAEAKTHRTEQADGIKSVFLFFSSSALSLSLSLLNHVCVVAAGPCYLSLSHSRSQ